MQLSLKQKLVLVFFIFILSDNAFCQMYITGPINVNGYINSSVTSLATVTSNNITSTGSIIISNGGNWDFSGNIIASDKGGSNGPNILGRSESVIFDGTGTYTNAAKAAGSTGYVVDGYAGSSNQASTFLLPIGSGNIGYPLTIPSGASLSAAYFDGNGNNENKALQDYPNNAPVEYSPYFDMPAGIVSGDYIFTYPVMPVNTGYNYLLTSLNTSVSGTDATNTQYSSMAKNGTYNSGSNYTTAAINLTAATATQVYFAVSNRVLSITLINFNAMVNGCIANLSWATSSESNGRYFGVEYSSDGSNFTEVAEVICKNILFGASYVYNYKKLKSGTGFFRLKKVDIDGKFNYSATVAVKVTNGCNAGLQIFVSPNPVRNILNIEGLVSGTTIIIYNANGQKMSSYIAVNTNLQSDMSAFANGIYTVNILSQDGSSTTVKVVKQ